MQVAGAPRGSARALVMGVLNVTPDSFSDGGRWLDRDAAIAHGIEMFVEGADIVDVGGESTRPGAALVDPAVEVARVEEVVSALAPHGRVSIDTRHVEVAEAAIAAGATLLNDVSASLYRVAADHGVGYVAMHMRGEPQTMQLDVQYDDVVAEVRDFLLGRAEAAQSAGVQEVWIDPGIGFGKRFEHNWLLLARLGEITATGLPVVVGTSRKRFLQDLLGAPATDVLEASIATAVQAMLCGARMVRVHDVAATVQAARIAGEPLEAA